jgi:hypothetical protein
MKTVLAALAVTSAFLNAACGATTRSGVDNATDPRLTTSTVTFTTLDDGKDAKSAVTVQLLSDRNELAAEVRSSGVEFDDQTTSAPLAMSLTGALPQRDVQNSRLRLQLTPDGRDTWSFDVRLTLGFSDNTQRRFGWSGVVMDERNPERTLALAGAGVD